jgi:hypothetical protein
MLLVPWGMWDYTRTSVLYGSLDFTRLHGRRSGRTNIEEDMGLSDSIEANVCVLYKYNATKEMTAEAGTLVYS